MTIESPAPYFTDEKCRAGDSPRTYEGNQPEPPKLDECMPNIQYSAKPETNPCNNSEPTGLHFICRSMTPIADRA